ncbi:hypothetical protein CFC21_017769 [Triticum aestivum]|uniref:F-box associated beta-propeller type 3 domain-containing protein n=4 Tax=Triticum TaxID=4564 RepID=A0A9R1R998_TRITD|nr:putative F-box protein At5g15660 [Triticum aestivum]XP_048561067.1 putative F-box protein At5g15660 [Triticum urartu]XP_048561068.1 putative F-box protein At5g15660 [Triticum urartu]KAF7002262.1 hypothetical protein CFC21_017769 [Triticum aestivum]VAH32968.1 unnamed protein product [Triticum turgidum subsp. durum]
MDPLVTLPNDLIFMEVLVRLPVKCLASCKFVSPYWRALIECGDFVSHHRNRSRASRPSILVIPRKNGIEDEEEFSDDISFYRLAPGQAPDTFEDEAELMLEKACPPEAEGITNVIYPMHCDGLVAIATGTDQVFLCNPATKEFVALPLGTPDVDIHRMRPPSAAIGYDQWKNQYVVARYFYRRRCYKKPSGKLDYDIGHEVFTLGNNSWSWEATADPPHAIGDTPPVCTRDAIYWGCDGSEDPRPSSLMRFSLRYRTFDLVPCPPRFAYNSGIEHLADLGGKLCHVNIATSETAFDVWQLADDGTLWLPRCRIDPDDVSFGSDAFLPLLAAGGRMLTMVSDVDQRLYWCDERSGDVEKVMDLEDIDLEGWDDSNYCIHHVVPYRESLISIRNYMV